jgi:hypothetical protein
VINDVAVPASKPVKARGSYTCRFELVCVSPPSGVTDVVTTAAEPVALESIVPLH